MFQNRRWDGDFLTVQRLIRDGKLGEIRTFESRFEWWMPEGFGNWRDEALVAEGGGILYDLGAHLIDQAIQLFGPVTEVHGETSRHGDVTQSDAEQGGLPLPAAPVRHTLTPVDEWPGCTAWSSISRHGIPRCLHKMGA